MNKKIQLIKNSILFVTASIFIVACSIDEKQTVITKTKLVMSEEFNINGAPNTSMWSYNIGSGANGWGNNELQYYTDRPENIVIENGNLKITARKEAYLGSAYTSARILTKGKFEQKYGRIEARIKLPLGKGLWPAFWMLGANSDTVLWPQCGEIDIMEYLGSKPTQVIGTVHGPGYSGGEAITKAYTLPNDRFDNDFHIFGIEWGENYINYYVDDVLYNQITPKDVSGEWVFNQPFYIILNIAVGGNLPGSPNSETVFPQTMLVDYVRVYE
ncbi:glycoside hydrolase family 16 protein [Flavobacterium franklandianum]|uniref:Glycoside hydrolase family 16 protein n=2 Tax=Flavobacterium TaxID=237 RepID=A0A553CM44_9FLAO|nr:glycoside hydrolase family 16 protein [Flavobacterium franklandianum]TRX21606.1 glycoside hydrolase family 16 protein [Flavobacterium franklandianum]TRX25210.1 glycoside hydrolase family 16 protein [Flavobacterium franklandianum]